MNLQQLAYEKALQMLKATGADHVFYGLVSWGGQERIFDINAVRAVTDKELKQIRDEYEQKHLIFALHRETHI